MEKIWTVVTTAWFTQSLRKIRDGDDVGRAIHVTTSRLERNPTDWPCVADTTIRVVRTPSGVDVRLDYRFFYKVLDDVSMVALMWVEECEADSKENSDDQRSDNVN